MRWTKFRIKTTTEAEDIIISELYELGLEGAQIEDKLPLTPLEKEKLFVDILPETEEDDGIAYLSFFVEEADDGGLLLPTTGAQENGSTFADAGKVTREDLVKKINETLDALRAYLDIGEGSVAVSSTEDTDWINNWKQYFHSFCIDDLLVVPSWEEPDEAARGKRVLHIDPGTAFGTGMHDTTQLCIRQLWKQLGTPSEGKTLLDVGTGSGILSIVALLYGASYAVGVDIDPCVLPAIEDNIGRNGVEKERFTVLLGNLLEDGALRARVAALSPKKEGYDVVVSNILAEVLVSLTPIVPPLLKKGGVYITSGILKEKAGLVEDAMERAGLLVTETHTQGDWVSVTARKP